MPDPRVTALEQGYMDEYDAQDALEGWGPLPDWLRREAQARGVIAPAAEVDALDFVPTEEEEEYAFAGG